VTGLEARDTREDVREHWRALVLVVDDDRSIRTSLGRFLGTRGFDVEVFASGEELLSRPRADRATCLVLDLCMPGLDGLELQERLHDAGHDAAIIFLTGHGDVPSSVRAMKAGAVDFLQKPFEPSALVDAVERALARDASRLAARAERQRLDTMRRALTPREQQVFALVTAGLPNKLVAHRLGTSEKTVKVHRARVMLKMHAESLAQLVRAATMLGVEPGC
jgi:FixJ family two-component response regulator